MFVRRDGANNILYFDFTADRVIMIEELNLGTEIYEYGYVRRVKSIE